MGILPSYPSENTGLTTLNTVRGPVGWWIVYVPLTLIIVFVLVVQFFPELRQLFFGDLAPQATVYRAFFE